MLRQGAEHHESRQGSKPGDAAECDKNRLACLMNLGAVCMAMKLYGEAVSHLNDALELSPDDPRVLRRRGRAHRGRGDFKEAKMDFVACVASTPSTSTPIASSTSSLSRWRAIAVAPRRSLETFLPSARERDRIRTSFMQRTYARDFSNVKHVVVVASPHNSTVQIARVSIALSHVSRVAHRRRVETR